ncbi:MAG TPA: GNAT family N-acetyltransferase [Dehalococcoidia bacterium]|nr:GNAT family N-acetyltransferase [Dehalococcoidia bacterium]
MAEWPEAELLWRADANYVAAMCIDVGSGEEGRVRQHDGVVAVCTGTPALPMNIVFVTAPPRDRERALREGIDFMDAQRQPFLVRIREGVDPGSERALEALGFTYTDDIPGMALYPFAVRETTATGLQIREVADETTAEHHVRVMAEAFEMPRAIADRILSLRTFTSTPDAHGYVGYLDGEPVATSALVVTHRVAGIYNVATLPSHRGRGIGEALTWHALRAGARDGCLFGSLQASEMGRPVYERMGFRIVARYRTYNRRR